MGDGPHRSKPRKTVAELCDDMDSLREDVKALTEAVKELQPPPTHVLRDAAAGGLGAALGNGNPLMALIALVLLMFAAAAGVSFMGLRIHVDHHLDQHVHEEFE